MNSENKQESVPSDTTKTIDPMSVPNECCGIYGLRNKLNDKWYVGQSINIVKRWEGYDTMHCKSQRKLYNALVKYGVDAFDKVILEQCPSDRLNEREDYWVIEKDAIENGYNIRSGGGSRGRHSTETKRLMSVAAIGRKKSASHISHLPQNQKGYKQSPELIAKRSSALRGIVRSAETRKRMSEAQRKLHPRKSHEEVLARRRELYRRIKPFQDTAA